MGETGIRTTPKEVIIDRLRRAALLIEAGENCGAYLFFANEDGAKSTIFNSVPRGNEKRGYLVIASGLEEVLPHIRTLAEAEGKIS